VPDVPLEPSGFIGVTALACILVSMLGWLTWRRRLARRALLLGIASGLEFLLAEGHQIEGSTWLPALLGPLGLVAMVTLCVDLAMAAMPRRARKASATTSVAPAAPRTGLPPNVPPTVLAQ